MPFALRAKRQGALFQGRALFEGEKWWRTRQSFWLAQQPCCSWAVRDRARRSQLLGERPNGAVCVLSLLSKGLDQLEKPLIFHGGHGSERTYVASQTRENADPHNEAPGPSQLVCYSQTRNLPDTFGREGQERRYSSGSGHLKNRAVRGWTRPRRQHQ